MPSNKLRELDEKRIGLLLRMSIMQACVCRKATQMPLLRRGLTEPTETGSYRITAAGKKAAKKYLRQYEGKKLVTYSGLSIGGVMILTDNR